MLPLPQERFDVLRLQITRKLVTKCRNGLVFLNNVFVQEVKGCQHVIQSKQQLQYVCRTNCTENTQLKSVKVKTVNMNHNCGK